MRAVGEPKPFRGVEVRLDECNGSFEKMLRRFVRRSREDGTVSEFQLRARGFVKPSQRRRTKKNVPR